MNRTLHQALIDLNIDNFKFYDSPKIYNLLEETYKYTHEFHTYFLNQRCIVSCGVIFLADNRVIINADRDDIKKDLAFLRRKHISPIYDELSEKLLIVHDEDSFVFVMHYDIEMEKYFINGYDLLNKCEDAQYEADTVEIAVQNFNNYVVAMKVEYGMNNWKGFNQ